MPGCTRGCGKKKKREARQATKTRRTNEDKAVETEYISGQDDTSDTGSTEYQTIPGRSTPSVRSKLRKKESKFERGRSPESPRHDDGRDDDRDDDVGTTKKLRSETSRRRKSPRKPVEPPDDDYSTDRTASTARSKKSKRSSASSPRKTETEITESSQTCATVNLSKFLSESSETVTSGEDFDGVGCEDEECGAGTRFRTRVKRQKPPSESSESWSETSTASSERCPSLCRTDPSKLPPRPTKCDSHCRKQAWLERQRDKRQAEMDDYLLRKGFRYFDDMCKCSLKCLMSQICVDPFARSIAFSTVGFFLGVKLCWELDGYYIPF